MRWVLWFLAFKLTFLSGITKILSGDRTWANWTALTYHYQTQPIPAWTSWYAHQLPASVHYWSTAGMFVIELLVPWLVFLPPRFRRVRAAAAALMASLQAGIAATGNYGFFNLLTIVLYLALLDDGMLTPPQRRPAPELRVGPTNASARVATVRERRGHGHRVLQRDDGRSRDRRDLGPAERVQPLVVAVGVGDRCAVRLDQRYGLFRVMTTDRPEIVIEASADGDSWKEYEFRWKAGDVRRRPPFVEPYMPRLDWQMWFAALDPRDAQVWLGALVRRLLDGDEAVTRLLAPNPLGAPVRCVRLVDDQYPFTSRAERAASGAWWKRERAGALTNAICR